MNAKLAARLFGGCVLLLSTGLAAAAGWEKAADAPEAKAGAAGAIMGNDFYLIGGYSKIGASPSCYKLDLVSNKWSKIAPLPSDGPIASTGATAFDGKIYFVGGVTKSGSYSNACMVYDPKADSWAEDKSKALPSHVAFAAVTVFQGGLFIVGGADSDKKACSTSAYWLNPNTGTGWKEYADVMRQGRLSPAVGAASDGYLWVAGGSNGHDSLDTIELFDSSNNYRETRLSTKRTAAAGFTIGNSFYVVGGNGGETTLRTGENFSIEACSSRASSSYLKASSDSAYAGNNYWLVKSGGVDSESNFTSETEIFYAAAAPYGQDDQFTTKGTFSSGKSSVLSNDQSAGGDTKAFLAEKPKHGTVTLAVDGTFSYEAEKGFSGDDTFRYVAKSRGGTSQPTLVTLHVSK